MHISRRCNYSLYQFVDLHVFKMSVYIIEMKGTFFFLYKSEEVSLNHNLKPFE